MYVDSILNTQYNGKDASNSIYHRPLSIHYILGLQQVHDCLQYKSIA
jgi:hypothetical protein